MAEKPRLAAYATVIKDRPDLRDLIYSPTLKVLMPRIVPVRGFFAGGSPIRDQWDRQKKRVVGNCTAQALANIVDFAVSMEEPVSAKELAKATRVSAGMLYHRGREVETFEQGAVLGSSGADDRETPDGLRSLRSALKGFYHNGVCSEDHWNQREDFNGQADSVEIANDARKTPLGSYFRLHPILNDYHAALNEVGTIYAAAEIHKGWEDSVVKRNNGVIELPADSGRTIGNHAFAIVGYTPLGFLVLNSWGKDWGGYDPHDPHETGALPGVALWRYQDWAERIIDGWVLRLGVTAPDAFKYSFGPQGLAGFMAGQIASVSTPRHELVGHYFHLDDGQLVTSGTLPTTKKSIEATCALIDCRYKQMQKPAPSTRSADGKQRVFDHVLLWLAGGEEPTKEIANHIGSTKDRWKDRGIYPITVMWCSDFIESALNLLGQAFEDAKAKVGAEGPSLDARVEAEARGVGRAFWRDIKRSARNAAAKDMQADDKGSGGMYEAFQQLMNLYDEIKLHIVAEGAGAILAAELIGELCRHEIERIASITLNMPACTVKLFEDLLLRKVFQGRSASPIHILIPDAAAQKRFRVGLYGGSLLDLVQMSFEEVPPVRQPLGKGLEIDEIQKKALRLSQILGVKRFAEKVARRSDGKVVVHTLRAPEGDQPIRGMRNLTTGKQAFEIIEKIIKDEL